MANWLENPGAEEDVVISSRIRLARNLEGYRFPQTMGMKESEKITEQVLEAIKKLPRDENYKFVKINNIEPLERMRFIEEHLISPGLINKPEKSSFLLRKDEAITIMINEEDHLRTQVLHSGLNFEDSWKLCNDLDDFLEDNLDFAFHKDFGYLTACPTNVGTGLRVSAMVHIPSIAMTGYNANLIQSLSKIGLTVRGIYGEGTKALGNLYQISNQRTLGETEEDIIKKIKNVLYQIITKERNIREDLLGKKKDKIEDKVFRSLGILKYSRMMTSVEAMSHISNVRLGKEMGILDSMSYKEINKLMIDIQPASIQKDAEGRLNKEERDIKRAKLIREII